MRRLIRLAATAGSLALATGLILPIAPAVAAPAYRFNVTLGETCVDGQAAENASFALDLLSKSGALLSTVPVRGGEFSDFIYGTTDGNGDFETQLPFQGGISTWDFQGGDHVQGACRNAAGDVLEFEVTLP